MPITAGRTARNNVESIEHACVSCDSCLKGNFRGKRYKCLICYDYDLCATCYEAGASTTRHNADHPMQCILTRSDFDLYYGGEAVSAEHPQSFTCPYCGKMGFTEVTLTEHCTAEHSDSTVEIVCPICASQPGGEPNHVTDDFAAHLALDHRSRDMDEPSTSRHMRRMPHAGRGINHNRTRRSQMQFTSTSGFSSLSPNNRDSMDPIAELLSQLSNVRRSNLAQSSTTSQLQQLQMQLQMERQQTHVARQQLERIPRRQAATTSISGSASAGNASLQSNYAVSLEPSSSLSSNTSGPQFLLSRCSEPVLSESEEQSLDVELADRSLFVQELMLSSLAQDFDSEEWDTIFQTLGLNFDGDTPAAFSTGATAALFNTSSVENDRESASAINGADHVGSSSSQQQNNPSSEDHQLQNAFNPAPRASGASFGRVSNRSSSNNPAALSNRGSIALRNTSRESLTSGSRQIGRTGSREGSSPSRRKSYRQVDDKNKTTEPPPPH